MEYHNLQIQLTRHGCIKSSLNSVLKYQNLLQYQIECVNNSASYRCERHVCYSAAVAVIYIMLCCLF